jgi:hypothetical protein
VDVAANQYVLLRDADSPSHTALGRYDAGAGKLVPLRKMRDGVWGIRPRNKEQHCALDLLLADDVKLVTLVGKAGTGKTMLAIAAGCRRWWRSGPTRACWCRGRSSRWGATSATCRRSRAEAEPLDAADLRQRRVPDGPVQAGRQERAAATAS